MALEADRDFCPGTRNAREKRSARGLIQKRKNNLAGKKAEREQTQPQLYGTSYFFVKMALTGQQAVETIAWI